MNDTDTFEDRFDAEENSVSNGFNGTICWETWNDGGHRVRTSKSHILKSDPESCDISGPSVTICGVRVPEHGDGTVHEDGSAGDGTCKQCEAAKRRAYAAARQRAISSLRRDGVYWDASWTVADSTAPFN